MATVTKSIGTTSRDYSTITLWEADLDDDTPYDAGDDAVGECYDDSAFDEDLTINGGGTLVLASITLTVASGEEHDGTAGTGARIDHSTGAGNFGTIIQWATAVTLTFSLLEVDGGENNSFIAVETTATTKVATLARLLIHSINPNFNSGSGALIDEHNFDGNAAIVNSIVYDIGDGVGTNIAGITLAAITDAPVKCLNNTCHNADDNAFINQDAAKETIQNCIGTDSTADYSVSAPSKATMDHNLASDTTASGTGSLDSKSSANQFVSTTGGSEDLHLKTGADAIDAGTDLVTTPSGVEVDIDGRDRDAQGDTWDMGAHEFVVVVSLLLGPHMMCLP